MKKVALVILVSILSLNVFADMNDIKRISEMKDSLDEDAAYKLTEEERSLSKQWNLKESDWIKYKKLMSGPRGVWSPGLDPLTALGVSETDTQERKRYAEIWMKMESRRYELEIAFEVERMKAGKRLFGEDALAIDNRAWIAEWERENKEITKQVVVFMDVSCLEECEQMFSDVKLSLDRQSRLDIFFAEGATSEDIGTWATFMKLKPEEVKSRRVTLNFDEGTAVSMGVNTYPKVKVVDLKNGRATS